LSCYLTIWGSRLRWRSIFPWGEHGQGVLDKVSWLLLPCITIWPLN
jgi:hypothetical protein